MVLESCVHVTSTFEVGTWGSEEGSVWRFGSDAGGDLAARKKPHFDRGTGPFHGVDASDGRVETRAKGVSFYGVDIAAGCARRTVEGAVVE